MRLGGGPGLQPGTWLLFGPVQGMLSEDYIHRPSRHHGQTAPGKMHLARISCLRDGVCPEKKTLEKSLRGCEISGYTTHSFNLKGNKR